MKSWITAFAFAGKWGGLGASGETAISSPRARCDPDPIADSASKLASAILPTPMPQSWKKCRRVCSRRFMVVS